MGHTPEPWSYDLLSVTPAVYGKSMLSIIGDDVVSKSDARRIVACVNACIGMTTSDLEEYGLDAISVYLSGT